MKQRKLYLLVLMALFTLTARAQTADSGKLYQNMSRSERSAFISAEARRVAKELSGTDYEFTPAFEEDIQQFVNHYTRRIGNGDDKPGRGDLRIAIERGRAQAPVLMAAFRARNLSPLFGLYLPFVESEFVNIESASPMGAIGMFQFVPQTGKNYGLTVEELLDVSKSADAAARYIADSIQRFNDDQMKEALALLAYNRGADKTAHDLKLVLNEQNKRCSVCALAAGRNKLDQTFRQESVFYVPRFFAAAIIGENPRAFGLQMQPLSSN